ncbi:MAG: glucosaminidase domain-containing protein [Saprospiraceae bacterium]
MKTTLTCLAAGLVLSMSAQTSPAYHEYIQTYAEMAMQEMYASKIPASITLAQGLLESGAGRSTLATKANNHFGIKCHSSWTGKTMYRKDDDRNRQGKLIESCFRKYDDPAQSYSDHSDFLTGSRRYAGLFLLKPTNYKGWAKGLKKAGYATSSTYATKLIGLIETYNLDQFDQGGSTDYLLASSDTKVTKANAELIVAASTDRTPAISGAAMPSTSRMTFKQPKITDRVRVLVNNDVEYTYAAPGETLSDIARRTRSYSSEIVKYNEDIAHVITPLEQGTRIYLKPKRKAFRGRQKTHRIRSNETMQSIADKYAIKTSALYKRNNMEPGTEPRAGEEVYIRGRRNKNNVAKLRRANKAMSNLASTKTQFESSRAGAPTGAISKTKSTYTPRKVVPPAKQAAPKVSPPKAEKTTRYVTVQSGDTLWRISSREGISVSDLRSLNSLESDTIHVGKRLRVK